MIRLPGKPPAKSEPAKPDASEKTPRRTRSAAPKSASPAVARKPTARMSTSGPKPKPRPSKSRGGPDDEYDELDPSDDDEEGADDADDASPSVRRKGKGKGSSANYESLVESPELASKRDTFENRALFLAWKDDAEVRFFRLLCAF